VIEDTKLSDLHAEQFIISSQIQGPTSSQTPYLVSANSHVYVESLITTGDQALNGYTMVGIPDGLGAFDNGNGTFTVLMNHEISNSNPALAGAVRAHGANGAFVSEWVIDKTSLQVLSGHDLMHDVWLFDTATQTYVDHNAALNNGVSFSRFCSADLADANAFYNPATGLGFNPADGRLFLDGEENNAEGRAMAHIVGGAQDGNSYELAWLGNMAYENQLANAFTGDKTVVAMLNDTAAAANSGGGSIFTGNDRGEVYFYVGNKQATGLAIEKAGLPMAVGAAWPTIHHREPTGWPHYRIHRAHQGWQAARARRNHRYAFGGAAGHPHRRRICAGLRGEHLVRRRGTEGHAGRGRRQAQQRVQCGPRRSQD
jgi:hypothetical protein